MRRFVAAVVVAVTGAVSASCSVDVNDEEAGVAGSVPAGCAAVDIASSPDKVELLTDIARRFNASEVVQDEGCAFVRVYDAPSGVVAQHLSTGWRAGTRVGPRPVIWSPSARAWGALLNAELVDDGRTPMVETDAPSFAVTPLVIGMPRPMAEALGWPAVPVGFGDLAQLAGDPAGWAARGHPEWGRFVIGKANLALSTSGLSSTIASSYAAAGRTDALAVEDIDRPEVATFLRSIEGAVIHYGNTTSPFLDNLARADEAGAPLSYISAVLLEEQALVAYNRGEAVDTEGRDTGGRVPSTPLVAIYPKEGTVLSDNPLFVVDARWVSVKERAAAVRFQEFVSAGEAQRAALAAGFRPVDPSIDVSAGLTPALGVDPALPAMALPVPDAAVLEHLIDRATLLEKPSTVMIALDVSGSMGEAVGAELTKLDLVRSALVKALRTLGRDDQIALRAFSTDIEAGGGDVADLVPFGPALVRRGAMRSALETLEPEDGTALYETLVRSVGDVAEVASLDRINAVVVITDGRNEDDDDDLDATLRALEAAAAASSPAPVRVFTVAYGGDADRATLERLSAATGGASYDASDPGRITTVLEAVLSNF